MRYTVVTTPRGHRSLRKLSKSIKKPLRAQFAKLQSNPHKGEQLRGEFSDLRSLHFTHAGTHYRVVYQINDVAKEVVIHYAGKRENFYKELKRGAVKLLS